MWEKWPAGVLNKFSFPSFFSNHFVRRSEDFFFFFLSFRLEDFKFFREGEEITKCERVKVPGEKTLAANRAHFLAYCGSWCQQQLRERTLEASKKYVGESMTQPCMALY